MRNVTLTALAALTLTACAGTASGIADRTPTPERTITRQPAPSGAPSTPPVRTPPATPPTAPSSGSGDVDGTTVTSRCPIVTDPPCPAIPVPAHIVATNTAGATATTVDSGADGRFHLTLKPGRYVLHVTATAGAINRPATVNVTVNADKPVVLTIHLDSGIR